MNEFPSRASIRDSSRNLGLMSEQPTPEQAVLDEVSQRMTRGMSEADAMRTELYLMDVIDAVRNGVGKKDAELLESIKRGDGFANLSTVFVVNDSTTLVLIREISEKLSS